MVQTTTSPLKGTVTAPFPDGVSFEGFGTVTVNGTSNVTITDAGYTSGDFVLFALKTVGGTVGQLPHVTVPTTGAPIVVATASDTSVYNYVIFTGTSQAT